MMHGLIIFDLYFLDCFYNGWCALKLIYITLNTIENGNRYEGIIFNLKTLSYVLFY
jgi:hypothetical protein